MTLWELNLLCWSWELRLLPLVVVAWFVLFAIKCRSPEREYEEAMSRNIEFVGYPLGFNAVLKATRQQIVDGDFIVQTSGDGLSNVQEAQRIVDEVRARVANAATSNGIMPPFSVKDLDIEAPRLASSDGWSIVNTRIVNAPTQEIWK